MQEGTQNYGDFGICPVCRIELLKSAQLGSSSEYTCHCPRCSYFRISRITCRAFDDEDGRLGKYGSRTRANLSSWIRKRKPQEIIDNSFLSDDNPSELGREFWSLPSPFFHEMMDNLLLALEDKSEHAGKYIDWPKIKNELIARSWVKNEKELKYIIECLDDEKLIKYRDIKTQRIAIHVNGWERIRKLHESRGTGTQGFVAMWFHKSLDVFYNSVLAKTIESAGYAPLRIDQKEHANKIDDEILVEIKKSKFVIADFTKHRGGVYFEAGFAMGIGLPVIWTCKKSDRDDLHFDIRQYNCLSWTDDNLDEFTNKLKNRILAIVGPGPNYRD